MMAPQDENTAAPFDKELDLSGLNCPLPILHTKVAFAGMRPGQVLKITYSGLDSVRELEIFSRQYGYPILESRLESGKYTFLVKKL